MEGARHAHSSQAVEEMEAVKRENEELKEVLSAVQLDLEAKTEVKHNWKGGGEVPVLHNSCHPVFLLSQECQQRATEVESLEQQVDGANTRIEVRG